MSQPNAIRDVVMAETPRYAHNQYQAWAAMRKVFLELVMDNDFFAAVLASLDDESVNRLVLDVRAYGAQRGREDAEAKQNGSKEKQH